MSIHRGHAFVAIVLGAALVWPAAAGAQGTLTLTIGPLAVKQYVMTVIPECGRGGCGASMRLSRSIGHSVESHEYAATKATVRVSSLRSAHETASFGSLGRLDMTFQPSSATKPKLPSGCRSTGRKTSIGTVKGSFSLKADSGYFKTVSATKLPAFITSNGTVSCGPLGNLPEGHGIYFGETNTGPLDPYFYATKIGDKTSISVSAGEQRKGVRINHSLLVAATASHLTAPDDLSSVTLQGVPGLLDGSASATFSAAAQPTVPLTGRLTAHFDSFHSVELVHPGATAYAGKQ